jgi:glycosyltransferase involved in cell wall biosynthesis
MTVVAERTDPEVRLRLPRDDVADPVLSIVIPALDEEVTITQFVRWCHEGLAAAGVAGEILIVDSSQDATADLALAAGARVLSTPKRGLGRAYIDALPYIRGRWVLMGDADCTYDFRELGPFIERLSEGYEFVMGSRWKGTIEPGSMPKLHRYFGSPLTTWIFNRIYATQFSDIHCGMRALTLDAYKELDLQSQSWEYASEMILKASKLGLRCTEVPVRFWKDPEGRESHLAVRGGWIQPWKAGWKTLRVQFLYAPDFFLWWPGWAALAVGLVLSVLLAAAPLDVGSFSLGLHWSLLALVLTMLGYSALQLATLARVHHDFEPRFADRVLRLVSYNRGICTAFVLFVAGLIPNIVLVVDWISGGLSLDEVSHPAVFGLTLIVLGFQTFAFTLLLHSLAIRRNTPAARRQRAARSRARAAASRTTTPPVR